jgi:hypothetical protein
MNQKLSANSGLHWREAHGMPMNRADTVLNSLPNVLVFSVMQFCFAT